MGHLVGCFPEDEVKVLTHGHVRYRLETWPFALGSKVLQSPRRFTWLQSGPENHVGLSACMKPSPGLWSAQLIFCL